MKPCTIHLLATLWRVRRGAASEHVVGMWHFQELFIGTWLRRTTSTPDLLVKVVAGHARVYLEKALPSELMISEVMFACTTAWPGHNSNKITQKHVTEDMSFMNVRDFMCPSLPLRFMECTHNWIAGFSDERSMAILFKLVVMVDYLNNTVIDIKIMSFPKASRTRWTLSGY